MKNKKWLIIICLCFFYISGVAQKFIITDVNIQASDVNDENSQSLKKQMLGAKVALTIYDSSVKVTIRTNDDYTIENIYDKYQGSENKYFYQEKHAKIDLILSKTFNYINSAKMEGRGVKDGKDFYITYTLKRE